MEFSKLGPLVLKEPFNSLYWIPVFVDVSLSVKEPWNFQFFVLDSRREVTIQGAGRQDITYFFQFFVLDSELDL